LGIAKPQPNPNKKIAARTWGFQITLDVARLTGTSLLMIEKHYGHLVDGAARLRLAADSML
jgi:hypothetical protein